ncbi:MAG: polysaccharide deacetylase family protein, partial [Bacteroidales bacterium]|nr:polysaccharide deacetylase family protein [Bacteroidales bacterium]
MKLNLRDRIKVRLIVNPQKWARLIAGRVIWQMKGGDNKIYLTFDDGPVPEVTPWVLETLRQYKAQATFFCVGGNVRKHPDLFNHIIENGHGTGNHSFSHLNGFKTGIRQYIRDVYKAHKYVNSPLFRPPYGMLRGIARSILKARFRIILWDVLSMDYDPGIQARQVVRNVISNTHDGSIVVFHDSIKAKENLQYALPR